MSLDFICTDGFVLHRVPVSLSISRSFDQFNSAREGVRWVNSPS